MAPRLVARGTQRDYSPISWTNYFDEAFDVSPTSEDGKQSPIKEYDAGLRIDEHGSGVSQSLFRVYAKNFKSPYAPSSKDRIASASQDSSMTEFEFNAYNQYPTLVTLHGGGYSGLTWAQFTQHIEQECHCRLMAIDLRSHGDTITEDDERMDIDTLVDDVIRVTHATHRLCGFSETPKIILIGHSMGGAIAIKCSTKCVELLPSLAGFVIIDVVEGTAKDALPLMMNVIKTRPTRFTSLENAIEWSFRSGMAKNLDAARVSMPGNLLNIPKQHLAIHDINDVIDERRDNNIMKHRFHINVEHLLAQKSNIMKSLPQGLPISPRVVALKNVGGQPSAPISTASPSQFIEESDESVDDISGEQHPPAELKADDDEKVDKDGYKRPPGLDATGYCWRTDLAKTQPYWPSWFEGLSEQMLSAPVQGKFLLLAGIDRLDRTLTIGQMQGKFMMKVLPKCGHAVHEDLPERVATEIGQFLVRNKFTTSINK